jgi:hypothetical protein
LQKRDVAWGKHVGPAYPPGVDEGQADSLGPLGTKIVDVGEAAKWRQSTDRRSPARPAAADAFDDAVVIGPLEGRGQPALAQKQLNQELRRARGPSRTTLAISSRGTSPISITVRTGPRDAMAMPGTMRSSVVEAP